MSSDQDAGVAPLTCLAAAEGVRMLCRLTLAVALVCVGSICSCVKADPMSRLAFPRDYGVKLCGREFIRAVIFTCGGSRWRRSLEFGEFTTSTLLFATPSCCVSKQGLKSAKLVLRE